MENTKKIGKKNIFSWIALLVGAVLLFLGVYTIYNTVGFKINASKCDAYITSIETYVSGTDSDGRDVTSHSVHIRYQYEGETYDSVLSYYSALMKEEDRVTIYVDPDDPSNFMDSSGYTGPILLLIFGAVILLVSISFIRKRRKALAN